MNISILGSTGSIGTQALMVVDDLKGIKDITVKAISGNKNTKLLEGQARKYKPEIVAAYDKNSAKDLKTRLSDTSCKVVCGQDGLIDVATHKDSEMVLSSIVGFSGLVPTLCAIDEGKDIALANKETLVTAGQLFMDKIAEKNVRLLPVDSEHCAIFQSLEGNRSNKINKILLTCSGGPFFGKTSDELKSVTKEMALNHPNWSMGAKITTDSATLMNKGLEVIEAKWLFGVDIDDIEVVIHRESIIHSMVEYEDLSVIAQLSLPSMKHPIQYAFTYPKRLPSPDKRVSFKDIKNLSFFEPDEDTFKCLRLAKEAGKQGGIMPTVLNAANEKAVEFFLNGKISFLQIGDIVEKTLSEYKNINNPTIDDILSVDMEVRERLK
ncbi:MAG: 1-deoxy-D-xylulose-5-phosphate reductoisomerase [Ruminococcaceae bacterium]|nr:1-deoxy-D-xylulose-5-phosphate reductoisomerase [Oscillospiraceae bacterium]